MKKDKEINGRMTSKCEVLTEEGWIQIKSLVEGKI